MGSYAKDKDKIIARLKKIEGQVRGIRRMVEEDKYCVDVLTQISSVIAASEKVGLIILQDHIDGCVRNAVHHDDGDAHIKELIDVVERFIKA